VSDLVVHAGVLSLRQGPSRRILTPLSTVDHGPPTLRKWVRMVARKTPTAKKATSSRTLAVREDESPWTAKELRDLRGELEQEIAQLRSELLEAESDLVDLMRDSGDGAGDDQADAGAKTYEREQEISLANNARLMLEQSEHALERFDGRDVRNLRVVRRPDRQT
jgi:RNA polymerase-binding transcription factor DksA